MDESLIFTAKQSEALQAVASNKYNFILYGGAIRGGKSFWGLGTLLILCEIFPNSRWAVIRESDRRIRQNTIPSFSKIKKRGVLKQSPYQYTHHNNSVILFLGENYDRDKDLDAFKGLEVNGFLFEEINECQEVTFNKAIERAGSWIIPTGIQPKPIILATCNPSFGWVKNKFYEPYKNGNLRDNWLYIPAKITDNPYLPSDYLESLRDLPKWEYEVFVEGNWDINLKTGNEFFHCFEMDKHIHSDLKFDINKLIHVSLDVNTFPYIAITLFQVNKIGEKYIVDYIKELPCASPYNSARKAGERVALFLKEIGYNQSIWLYGDRSTKAKNATDDENRSNCAIFEDSIKKNGFNVINKMLSSAPSVSQIGDFVNYIFEGKIPHIEIRINDTCKLLINDLIEVKQDKDGGMLKKRITDPKTKISYEPVGHCFVGNTMITTINGDVEIKNIKKGDLVLTRKGYKKVLNVYNNGFRKVKKYKIGDYDLICTPEHKIFTYEKGFKSINKLINSKTFCIFVEKKICKEKLLITTESIFTDTQNLKQKAKGYIFQEEQKLMGNIKKLDYMCINTYVKSVLFLNIMSFIIMMKIRSITILKILYALIKVNINRNICLKMKEKKYLEKISRNMHNQKQLNGINQMKGENGIENTYIKHYTIKISQLNVMNVVLNLLRKQIEVIKNIFVVKNINGNIKQEYNVKKDIINKSQNVQYVAMKQSENLFVQENAIIIEVYDIEVEDEHEYFANGILVHNCADNLKDSIVSMFYEDFRRFLDRFKPKDDVVIQKISQRPKFTM